VSGEATAFLGSLLDAVPDDLWTSLWTLADKRSHWFPVGEGVEPMAASAVELAGASDVYVSVSVARQAAGAFRRINSESSAGIMGLWADVDVATPDVHKKWNLPPDEEGAMSLVEATGLKPTLLVHSGHGLQAWWLFDEFWGFDSEEDRLEAAQLAQAWNTTLRVRAAEREWNVDSTFDLARVMRVPGTTNRKGTPAVPVALLVEGGPRYGRTDFDPFCVDDRFLQELGLSPSRSYVVGELRLDADASPPFAKFDAMMGVEPLFARSWDRTRRDLPDQSASSYDMSLASLAAMGGWADQEIVDLLVASRRKHGDDLKLRRDYYARTVAKAHDGIARDRAVEVMDELSDQMRQARQAGDDDEARRHRREMLESIGQQLGIEVLTVLKYRSTPPSYRLETPTGGIALGSASEVLAWPSMRACIVATTGVLIPRFKVPVWDRLVQMIFDACEDLDTGYESTEHGQISSWLSEYLMNKRPVVDQAEAAAMEYPYTDGERVHIFGSSFRRWLWLNRGERVTQRELGRLLRLHGASPIRLNVVVDGVKTTRSAWVLPEEA
jgi:hypothetical protein